MQLIDTHAHIYLNQFTDDVNEVIKRSKQNGVSKIYMPNIDLESIDDMLQVEKDFPDMCIPMMGIHPCSIDNEFEKALGNIENWLNKRTFSAIGEIGIDLYWDKTYIDQQIEAFEIQIGWAKKMGLPIVIHCRESIDLVIKLVKKHKDETLQGVFHCFTGSLEQAREIIDMDFCLGLGGVSTFKNSGLKEVIPKIPLKNILLETDSPYLAPVPYRGKRNEPSYLLYVANKIAEFKNITPEEVATVTSSNALDLFKHE